MSFDGGRAQCVFLSYAREDRSQVKAIRKEIEAAGHTVWQDVTAIEGGAEWVKEIDDAIRSAYAVVIVVSMHWSRWVRREFLYAEGLGKPIIPIKIDSCEIPIDLQDLNVIFFENDFQLAMRPLLKRLASLRAITIQAQPANPRQLEIEYLDRLILQHAVWEELYTPMAGFSETRLSNFAGEGTLRVKPSWIPHRFEDILEAPDSAKNVRIEQGLYEDILPAVLEMRQLVLLGDPGSGKTTTVWYIVLKLSQEAKNDPVKPLPVLVLLNEIGDNQHLEDYICQRMGIPEMEYTRLLHEGRLAFLLDGLNEFPSASRIPNVQQVKQLVDDCQSRGLIAVVTCRELDYSGELDLHISKKVKISPLDPLRVKRFIDSYFVSLGDSETLFWQLAGEKAEQHWRDFMRHVGNDPEIFWAGSRLPNQREWGIANRTWETWIEERQHLQSLLTLASNPYMLVMMTTVFDQTRHIPQNRSLLFRRFVHHLLIKREHMAKASAEKLIQRLGHLAYHTMHKVGMGTAFSEAIALEYLHDNQSIYHACAANILSRNEHEIVFTHQLLQEYFAATTLVELLDDDPEALAFLATDGDKEDISGWDETMIFLGGLYPDDKGGFNRVLDLAMHNRPILACRIAVESGKESEITIETRNKLVTHCRALMCSDTLSLLHRYQIAVELGRLNLPLPADTEHLVLIDGGTFDYLQGEKMVDSFFIARSPVTNREFRAFMEKGYVTQAYWGEHWEWLRWHIQEKMPFYFNRSRPELTHADAPVVGISWYEAEAFCRWKTETLDPALRREGWVVRLPNSSEWLVAVRGKEGRYYPWGNRASALRKRCQFQGSMLPGPAPVGLYPLGDTPEGISDLIGNVFEYMYAETNRQDPMRICRGGSWLDDADRLECTDEETIAIDERIRRGVGFRYVYARALD
jgi:hypothetical protein